jgi:hypothetical protein
MHLEPSVDQTGDGSRVSVVLGAVGCHHDGSAAGGELRK